MQRSSYCSAFVLAEAGGHEVTWCEVLFTVIIVNCVCRGRMWVLKIWGGKRARKDVTAVKCGQLYIHGFMSQWLDLVWYTLCGKTKTSMQLEMAGLFVPFRWYIQVQKDPLLIEPGPDCLPPKSTNIWWLKRSSLKRLNMCFIFVPFGVHQLVEFPTVWLRHAFTACQDVDLTCKRGTVPTKKSAISAVRTTYF